MARKLMTVSAVLFALVALTGALAAAPNRWLHVLVEEDGEDGATVRVNLPLDVVNKVLPLIRDEHLRNGRVRIEMDGTDVSWADLRAVWDAVRKSKDGEYVAVDGRDEKVRVAKQGSYLVVRAEESCGKSEKVNVRMPLAVVDAVMSGTGEEIDLQAALEALAREQDGDLVVVRDDDSRVRIWIDSNAGGE